MQALSTTQLLALWDAGQTRHPLDRALLALALAMPEQAPDQLADQPVGWREIHLLALRNAMFGNALDGYATCPSCASLMEFSLDAGALLAELPQPPSEARVMLDGGQWRLPTSRDQAMILDAADPETAVAILLERCRIGQPAATSPALVAELETRLEALDPAANIRLGMQCTDCGQAWDAVLDIGSCFWAELGTCARRLLESVHRLAGAYGWREADILALSPARRAAYLSLIG